MTTPAMYTMTLTLPRGAANILAMRYWNRFGAVATLLLASLAGALSSEAAPSADDKALATALFKEGRALMTAGEIHEACQKLEESHNIDPSGGTLLNIALCHEREGRLARAWAEFNEAAAFARRDGRADREHAALEHGRAIEPRLSKLTIVVPEGSRAEGFKLERDGSELGPATWSMAMPVDGGEHVVRASAPGREPFSTKVVIGKESDAKNIEIPLLALSPVASAPAAVAPTPVPAVPSLSVTAAPASAGDSSPRSVRRTVAWTLTAAGVVQLGLAGYFGVRAFNEHSDSNSGCPANRCTVSGAAAEDRARTTADVSTVLTITGIATAAAGVVLLVTSPRAAEAHPAEMSQPPMLQIFARGSALGIQGRF